MSARSELEALGPAAGTIRDLRYASPDTFEDLTTDELDPCGPEPSSDRLLRPDAGRRLRSDPGPTRGDLPVIAGADLSTKSSGYAAPDGDLCTLKPRSGLSGARRLHAIAELAERAIRIPPRPALVVLEGYSLASPGRLSLVRLGELGGVVRLRLFELGILYVEIPPSQLKLYATGKGSAEKPEMVAAAVELGARPANDDEADAFLLRHAGRAAYGLEPLVLKHRIEVAAAIAWPKL